MPIFFLPRRQFWDELRSSLREEAFSEKVGAAPTVARVDGKAARGGVFLQALGIEVEKEGPHPFVRPDEQRRLKYASKCSGRTGGDASFASTPVQAAAAAVAAARCSTSVGEWCLHRATRLRG